MSKRTYLKSKLNFDPKFLDIVFTDGVEKVKTKVKSINYNEVIFSFGDYLAKLEIPGNNLKKGDVFFIDRNGVILEERISDPKPKACSSPAFGEKLNY